MKQYHITFIKSLYNYFVKTLPLTSLFIMFVSIISQVSFENRTLHKPSAAFLLLPLSIFPHITMTITALRRDSIRKNIVFAFVTLIIIWIVYLSFFDKYAIPLFIRTVSDYSYLVKLWFLGLAISPVACFSNKKLIFAFSSLFNIGIYISIVIISFVNLQLLSLEQTITNYYCIAYCCIYLFCALNTNNIVRTQTV